MYEAARPLWVKVNILRNKVFGHRSVEYTVEEAFKEAGLSPNDLRDLIKQTENLMNAASHAWDRSVHAFNMGAGEDLTQLLIDISGQSPSGSA